MSVYLVCHLKGRRAARIPGGPQLLGLNATQRRVRTSYETCSVRTPHTHHYEHIDTAQGQHSEQCLYALEELT